MKIKYFKDVLEPQKSHSKDCGLDLYLPEGFLLHPFETKVIGLGLGISVPEGYAAMLVPRSSTAKKGLICQTSIIDPGYTGEIHLVITNCSNEVYEFYEYDRLVSLIIYSILNPILEKVNEFEKSERGENGLGSTGK